MSESPNVDTEQPFISHLVELRNRLLRSVIAIAICFVCIFPFANEAYEFLAAPLNKYLIEHAGSMIATGVASPFLVPFKLSLILAFFISMPVILFQIWGFIAPALYQNEKKLAIPLFVSSVFLFYAGIAFAYFVVLPIAFEFFTSFSAESIALMPDITNILNFALKMFFAFGLAFQIPVATFLMLRAGLTTVNSLKEKRPYILIGCFVVGMLVTPPDVISQTILALPMYLLFELGLLLGGIARAKKDEKDKAEAEQQAAASEE